MVFILGAHKNPASLSSGKSKRITDNSPTSEGINYGEYALVHAVIVHAVHEAASYRNPRVYKDIPLGAPQRGRGRPGSREIRAYKARKWMNIKNGYFTYYCNLLGWEAEWTRKKINKYLAGIDARSAKIDGRRSKRVGV